MVCLEGCPQKGKIFIHHRNVYKYSKGFYVKNIWKYMNNDDKTKLKLV